MHFVNIEITEFCFADSIVLLVFRRFMSQRRDLSSNFSRSVNYPKMFTMYLFLFQWGSTTSLPTVCIKTGQFGNMSPENSIMNLTSSTVIQDYRVSGHSSTNVTFVIGHSNTNGTKVVTWELTLEKNHLNVLVAVNSFAWNTIWTGMWKFTGNSLMLNQVLIVNTCPGVPFDPAIGVLTHVIFRRLRFDPPGQLKGQIY